MSEFGVKADRILEILNKEKTVTVEELKEMISLEDDMLLDFMKHAELIEMNKGKAKITEFGVEIITAK